MEQHPNDSGFRLDRMRVRLHVREPGLDGMGRAVALSFTLGNIRPGAFTNTSAPTAGPTHSLYFELKAEGPAPIWLTVDHPLDAPIITVAELLPYLAHDSIRRRLLDYANDALRSAWSRLLRSGQRPAASMANAYYLAEDDPDVRSGMANLHGRAPAPRPLSRPVDDGPVSPALKSRFACRRSGLLAEDRARLAEVVREVLRGEATTEDFVELANDLDLRLETVGAMPAELREEVELGACGHWMVEGTGHETSTSRPICDACADESDAWTVPGDSSYYYPRDSLYWSENYEAYYTYDIDGEEADDDDDDDDAGIASWNTDTTRRLNTPEIPSRADGDFTIGVEFECDPQDYSRRRDLVGEVDENFSGLAMCKDDGSLNATGVEVVLAPLTLERAKDTLNSIDFPTGTRAWDVGNCGLHVHIDSKAFTPLTLAKFIGFWNARENARFIRSIAGRHSEFDSQADQYARAIYPDSQASIVRNIKEGRVAMDRYRLTNLTALGESECTRLGVPYSGESRCYNTVELRGFRASMNQKRRDAQIEMAHATTVYARSASCRDMSSDSFVAWLRTDGARYPALRAWLGITRHNDKPGTARTSVEQDDTAEHI